MGARDGRRRGAPAGRGGPAARPGGGALAHLDRIDVSEMDPRLASATVIVACDVDNPLTGARRLGGLRTAEGATPAMVAN